MLRTMSTVSSEEIITEEFIADVCERLNAGKAVRRPLPGGGLLHIDRQLPFLCLYRRNPSLPDAGTPSFASEEAAYLSAPGSARIRRGLRPLIETIVEASSQRFGAFLILEVRAAADSEVCVTSDSGERQVPAPGFRIHAIADQCSTESVNTLRSGLERVRIDQTIAKVDVILSDHAQRRGMRALLSVRKQLALNCHLIDLEILPIHRDPESGAVLPKVLDELRRQVSKVLKKTFYTFAVNHTNLNPHHFYTLGRSRVPNSTWKIDHRLSDISQQVDLILMATPVNARSCWNAFRDCEYREEPRFRTRPLTFDPFVLKRTLLDIPVETVDDPTLAQLFRSVRNELDRQLTMLADLGTERFLLGSRQTYGSVEPELLQLANSLLDMTAAGPAADRPKRFLGPAAFVRRAQQDIERYRKLDPLFTATVELRHDLFSGLMVSGTRLLVGRETSVPASRVRALLSHEIGTHLVTRHNGMRQPMALLQSGLAGYDPLQEGLAVLSEYLVGGLSVARVRLLAARVVATQLMLGGSDFRTTFRQLVNSHAFEPYSAFTIVLRVFRGGGLTKDAAYLRGLNQVIRYLNAGGRLEPLYVGKPATGDLPLIRELLLRDVLRPPAILPDFLTSKEGAARLARLRGFRSVQDLADDILRIPADRR